jgi:alkylhydroperoxidase family enzyme
MTTFPVHSLESAPKQSKQALERLQSVFGFIPNMPAAMSTSPVLINSFVDLFTSVHAGSFSEPQLQTLLLTNAVTNASAWPVALHTSLALQQGVSAADAQAIRDGRLPKDAKLAALSTLARTLIETRGHLSDRDVESFLAAGFGQDHLLEVVLVSAASTITNYVSNVTKPPLEQALQTYAWDASKAA